SHYSIELDFQIATTSNFSKIIDFKNLTADQGLYNENTFLDFFNVASGPNGAFSPNTDVQVVLTRDGTTKQVVGYVNGVQQFTFGDTSDFAVFDAANSIVQFFKDDTGTQAEASAGVVDRIRVYSEPLTAAQVNALFNSGAPGTMPAG